jgi:hypothetical protein
VAQRLARSPKLPVRLLSEQQQIGMAALIVRLVYWRLCNPCRFFLGTWNMKGFLNEERPVQTLRQVLDRLKETYCGTIGYEVRQVFGFRVAMQIGQAPCAADNRVLL